jgi:hypothetical protein
VEDANQHLIREARQLPRVKPFLVGTAVGGIAGALAGMLLGVSLRSMRIGLSQLGIRRSGGDEPRFELLSQ